MPARVVMRLVAGLVMALASCASEAAEPLTVLMSGGFAPAYREVLPEFERGAGVTVTTLSGSSQGTGPHTVRAQLERGVEADVVVLSREGLDELIAAGRIVEGSAVGLARTPLGAAVRLGAPKPDIGTVEALTRALLSARLVAMPGSTSGLFMRDVVFPRLGVAGRVASRLLPRGTDSTALVAAGEADLAIGPVSELVGQPGIALVGPLPEAVQLVQVFTAAVVAGSRRPEAAERLIAFLASDRTAAAIGRAGMEPADDRRPR